MRRLQSLIAMRDAVKEGRISTDLIIAAIDEMADQVVALAAGGVEAIRNPPTEYERKLAKLKEDFPYGI